MHGFVRTLDSGSLCAKSDGLIKTALRDELLVGVQPLLDVEDKLKDWHPNSGQKVLNLVHPSLFPLVYGRTQVLEHGHVGLLDCLDACGRGEIPPEQIPEVKQERYGRWGIAQTEVRFSSRFQWLPADVKFVGTTGTDVEITSYINNLFPAHHLGLYSTISKFIGKAIPMWNEVLVKGYNGRIPPRIKVWHAQIEPSSEPDDIIQEESDDDEINRIRFSQSAAKVLEYLNTPDNPDVVTESDEELDEKFAHEAWIDEAHNVGDLHEAVNWKYKRVRRILHPEPGDSISFEEWKAGTTPRERIGGFGFTSRILNHEYQEIHLEQDFRAQGLQVIVKLASIELTPEKSEYAGGDWHLEGMMNERKVFHPHQ